MRQGVPSAPRTHRVRSSPADAIARPSGLNFTRSIRLVCPGKLAISVPSGCQLHHPVIPTNGDGVSPGVKGSTPETTAAGRGG